MMENKIIEQPVTRAFFHAVRASVTGNLRTDKAVLLENVLETARKESENAIKLYNNKRLHLSLGYKTPEQVFKKGA